MLLYINYGELAVYCGALLPTPHCVPPLGAVCRVTGFRYEPQKHDLPGGKEFNTLDLFSAIVQGPFTLLTSRVHPGVIKTGGALFMVLRSQGGR